MIGGFVMKSFINNSRPTRPQIFMIYPILVGVGSCPAKQHGQVKVVWLVIEREGKQVKSRRGDRQHILSWAKKGNLGCV